MSENTMSRRNFVTSAAVGLGTAALVAPVAGASADEAAAEPLWDIDVPETWDYEADMVVLGCGIGGSCALVEGHELGMSVIGVQANKDVLDCSCSRSGGAFCAVNTSFQRREGIEDSVDLFYKDMMRDGGEMGDPDVIRAWGEVSGETLDWLYDFGAPIHNEATYDAAKEVGSAAHSIARDYRPDPVGLGLGWMTTLQAVIDDYEIPILYNTRATKLLQNAEGRVIGARAETQDGTVINLKANKGVLVSTGGMGHNKDMWARYSPFMRYLFENAEVVNFGCPSTVVGDGIKMLEDAGAFLWPTAPVVGNTNITDPDWQMDSLRKTLLTYHWENNPIIVNKNGERFYDESSFHVFIAERPYLDQPGMGTITVFDEDDRLGKDGVDHAQWTLDCAPLLGHPEQVGSADTLEELAEYFGMDPEKLVAAVEDFNARCDEAVDGVCAEPDPFGRTKFTKKIQTPPFWGIYQGLGVTTSKGGAKINAKGQVIQYREDTPIPSLYAAGEDSMFSGHGDAREHIVGGCNSYAACIGRIAARNIMNEEPWD